MFLRFFFQQLSIGLQNNLYNIMSFTLHGRGFMGLLLCSTLKKIAKGFFRSIKIRLGRKIFNISKHFHKYSKIEN